MLLEDSAAWCLSMTLQEVEFEGSGYHYKRGNTGGLTTPIHSSRFDHNRLDHKNDVAGMIPSSLA